MGQMWRLVSHMILHMLQLTTKPYSPRKGKPYTLIHVEPIMFAIRTIASMRLTSHALRCEMGHWGTSDESGRVCTACLKQVRESKYHTLIQCFTFYHIRPCFPHMFDQAQSLQEFLSWPHVQSRLQLSLVKFLNIESRYSLSHVSREM